MQKLRKYLPAIFLLGFWLCLLAISALSLWPGDSRPPGSPWSDKFDHALAYFTLGIFWGLAHLDHGMKKLIPVFVLLAGWGWVLELLQGLPVIGRTTSFADLIADIAGLLLALVAMRFLQRPESG